MQKPWIAVTVGQGSSAIFWNTCWPRKIASLTVPLASKAWNSLISAPATKPLALDERITSPLGGSTASRSTMPSSSISTSWAKVLTEALARSKDSTITPSGRSWACQWAKRSPARRAVVMEGSSAGEMGPYDPEVVPNASNPGAGRRSELAPIRREPAAKHRDRVRIAAMSARAWLVAVVQRPQLIHTGRRSGIAPEHHRGSLSRTVARPRIQGVPGPMAETPSIPESNQAEPPQGGSQQQDSQQLDQELVRRVQRGDMAAFDLLVRKYQHRIAALIGRYVSDWSECQDIAQETFMRAYRALGNFRGDAQF